MPTKPLKICLATPEFAPLAKTGGLADVSAALSLYLHREGHDIRVLDPFVNGVLDVRGDECGTLVVEVGGMVPRKGHIRNLGHPKPQGFVGRFLQKRPGPR